MFTLSCMSIKGKNSPIFVITMYGVPSDVLGTVLHNVHLLQPPLSTGENILWPQLKRWTRWRLRNVKWLAQGHRSQELAEQTFSFAWSQHPYLPSTSCLLPPKYWMKQAVWRARHAGPKRCPLSGIHTYLVLPAHFDSLNRLRNGTEDTYSCPDNRSLAYYLSLARFSKDLFSSV